MGTIKIRATSLALHPKDPETEIKIIVTGDKIGIKSIRSNLEEADLELIKRLVYGNGYLMQPSLYMPHPGTMLNMIGLIQFLWDGYENKLVIETDGDIGTIPYKKGKVY